ncbi:FecR domain-containing protein [Chitinophaga ginsengisegetis]|uniref:FecR family protein n=1 Tax=Chitinophaga ginsengisegetis TaxID=393003 RepID=UPI000DBA0790|nr:FecR domain-containing protein [Chitinophaga ginsengisegetis]MDR6568430.1 ferric-dicitrate binding protein FerR (iron transport regulator) [Chitinophaga ginsengisegetis]MDR6648339.1 ferric-dicitrate binding protein FerR (iron transport regulator) [Chitinophaga ginsengisegetis]MDR6654511.1 ferric-dicitrate binding protein FerR (iron transport regulator) [Chitinophaga ginsengisegetis]
MMKPDAGLLQELIEKVQHNTASQEELRLLLQLLEENNHGELMPVEEWFQSELQPLSAGLKNKVVNTALQKNRLVKRGYFRRWLPYAAMLLVLPGLLMLWPRHEPRYTTIAARDGEIKRVVLPDSSVVILNARSVIRYNETYKSVSRDVILDGEAFFEIHPDRKIPFVVHTGNVRTQVLGTSFNVKHYPGEKLMVSVATGKVKVVAPEGKQVVLEKGSKVSYDSAGTAFTSFTEEPHKMNSWQQGIINMDNLTLGEVTTILERWYSVRIILETPQMGKHVLSGLQANTSLESVLESICFIYHLQYRREGNIIRMEKK